MGLTKPELIIFDCDGVLIDSEIISATTLIELLGERGLVIDLAHVQTHFLGRSFPTVAASIRRDFKLELPSDFEAAYRRRLLNRFSTELKPTTGIRQVLDALRVRVCVATSSSPERAARSLEIAGLFSRFDGHIYTASLVQHGKPAPDLFLHVSRTELVEPENCLIIEDSKPGMDAAIAANIPVLRYLGGSHFDGMRDKLMAEPGIFAFDSWAKFFDIIPQAKRSPDQDPDGKQN